MKFYAGAVAEDERRDAGEREDLPGHGLGLEHGLLGRRFGGDRAVRGHLVGLRSQLMAESICGWLGDARVTVVSGRAEEMSALPVVNWSQFWLCAIWPEPTC